MRLLPARCQSQMCGGIGSDLWWSQLEGGDGGDDDDDDDADDADDDADNADNDADDVDEFQKLIGANAGDDS